MQNGVAPPQEPDVPVAGDEFVRRLFSSVRELESDRANPELQTRVRVGIKLLDEIGARAGPVGLEARQIGADLRGWFDWRAAGGVGDPPKPHQGVTWKKGDILGMGGEHTFVDDVTTKPSFWSAGDSAPEGKYLVSPEFASFVLESGRPESTRRARLIGHASQRGQVVRAEEDGSFHVDLGDGRYEGLPVQQVVDDWESLRAAMQGVIPTVDGPVGDVVGRMPLTGAVGGFAARHIASTILGVEAEDLPPLTNVPTADPAFPFPTLPDFGTDHADAYRRLQDPRYLRAFEEVMGIVQAGRAQELLGADLQRPEDQTFWESLAAGGGFVTDWATSAVAAMPLRLVGQAGRAIAAGRNPVARVIVSRPIQSAAGVVSGAGRVLPFPLQTGLRTVGQFSAYETARAGLWGDDDLGSAALLGAKQGLLLFAAGAGISAARAGLMRGLERMPGAVGRGTRELGDRLSLLGRPGSADRLAEHVAALTGTGSLRATLAKMGTQGHVAEYAVKTVDAMGLGAFMGAWGDASADPEWAGMSGAQKTARLVDGLASPEAWGNALAFGLASQAHALAHGYNWGAEWEKAPPVARAFLETKMRAVAESLASPSEHQPVDDFRRAFERFQQTDPELFKQLEFVSQQERDARLAAAAELDLEEGDLMGPLQSPPEPPPGEALPPESADFSAPPSGPRTPSAGPSAPESAESGPSQAIPSVQDIGAAIRAELARIQGPPTVAGARAAASLPPPQPETDAGQVFHVERSGLSEQDQARLASGQPLEMLRGAEGGAELERVQVSSLQLSPEEFQYKGRTDQATGVDPEGPLAKLKSRDEFSEVSAGPILAYRRANGELVVVDGHQRTNAAKRLGVDSLNAYVIEEGDGVTPELARSLGAVLNMRNERGRPVDAAQVIRDLGLSRQDMRSLGLNPGNTFARKAEAVAELADPVFSMVLNETLPDGYAAAIGRHIPRQDQDRQLKAAELIQRSAQNEEMAESIARQVAATDLVSASQQSLFGDTGDVRTMIELRAMLEKPLVAELKKNKGFFSRLAKLSGLAETAGETQVDVDASRSKADVSEAVLEAIRKFADRKGTVVNEILNEAAQRLGPPHGGKASELAKWAADQLAALDWSKPETLEAARAPGDGPPLEQPGQNVLFQRTLGTQYPDFEPHRQDQPGPAGQAGGQLSFGTQVPGFQSHPGAIPGRVGAEGGAQSALQFPPGRSLRGRYREEVKRLLIQHFPLEPKQAEAALAVADAHARRWAEETGRTPAEWYPQHIGDIQKTNDIGQIGGMALAQMDQGSAPKGAVEFVRGGQAVIHALQGADFSTAIHELAHVWRRSGEWVTSDPEVASWAGVKKGFWNTAAEEKFARGVERYIRDGWSAENLPKRLERTFQRAAQFMSEVYSQIKGSPIDIEIGEPVRKKLDGLFMGKHELTEAAAARIVQDMTPAQIAAIYDRDRNRPEFLGMDPLELVGHIVRNDLEPVTPTSTTKLAQAGDNFHKATEILRSADLLEIPGVIVTPESTRRVIELANGGTPELERAFADKGRLDSYRAAVTAAREARNQMREGVTALAAEHADPGYRDRFEALFEFLDDPENAQAIQRLKELGAWGKDGRGLAPGVLQSSESLMQELRNASRMKATSGEALVLDRASPWIAFDRAPNEFRESWLSKHMKLKRLMDAGQRAFPPFLLRELKRLGSYTGGPWGGLNFLKSTEAMANRLASEQVVTPSEAKSRQANVLAQGILARLMEHWGWQHPPSSHLRLLGDAIERGAFKGMAGPEGFEKLQKGTGYLYTLAKDYVDLMSELGNELRLSGYLDERQFRKWVGRYVAHYYVKDDIRATIDDLRQGRMPASFAGRNMGRRASGEEESELRIRDPFWYLPLEVAQESKVREWHGLLDGLLSGGHAIGEAEYARLSAQDKTFYLPAALDPSQVKPGREHGYGLRVWHILNNELAQSMGSKGHISKPMQRRIDAFLGKSERGQLYIPRQSAQELDAVASHLFNPPALETWAQQAIYGYDLATRYIRRGLTIMRPKHWTLNISNSVMTNHLMGAASLTDFAKSALTGKGNYADAARDLIAYQQTAGLRGRLPKQRPSGMSLAEWDRLRVLESVMEKLSGGTFLHAGLDGQVISDLFSSVANPDDMTRQLERQIRASDRPIDEQSALIASVFDASRRMGTGLGRLDRLIGKLAGGDASERAAAIANHVGVYQAVEVFFKHAAVLSTLEKQPGLTLDQALAFAAGGTADYRNTSSALRAWNTAYGTFNNPLWQRTETGWQRAQRAVVRDMLKGRFWMYQSNMLFPKLRSAVIHPLRAAAVAAIMSGIGRQLYQLAHDDPEEDAGWQESLSGAMYTAGSRPELLDEPTLEAYRKMGGAGWFPDVVGGARHQGWRGMASKLWNRVLQGEPFIFPGPKVRRRESVSGVADLAPGWGDWVGVTQGVGSVFAPHKTQKEKVDEFLNAVSFRTLELSMGLVNGAVRLAVPRPGDTRSGAALRQLQQAVGYVAPTISPLFLASKDGTHLVENMALGGQSLGDWWKGYRLGSEEPDPLSLVGEALYSALWRNQQIRQPAPVGASQDPVASLLMAVIPGMTPSEGPHWDTYKKAARGVHEQTMLALGDIYGEWVEKFAHVSTLDSAVVNRLYAQDGPVEQYIAGERDPELRDAKARYWARFKASAPWREAIGLIEIAGRRREMAPGMFQEAISRSLRDPSGGQLLNWLDEQVRKPGALGRENIQQLATVFHQGVEMPEPGSEKFVQWQRIARTLSAAGYTPVDSPQEWLDAALRTLGIKPEVQGANPLREALLRRPTPQRR